MNAWRTNRGKPRRDTADTASGKDRCSVTEEAKREKETVDNAPAVNYPRRIRFFSAGSSYVRRLTIREESFLQAR